MPDGGRSDGLIEHFFRHQHGAILARLLRRFGAHRLDLAEEAIQEAMSRAVILWPVRGIPDRPEGWLWRVACNHAVDVLRIEAREGGGRYDAARAHSAATEPGARPESHRAIESLQVEREGLEDEMLAMVFLCCHPAFSRPACVALTLEAVAGFGRAEIARAFLLPEATIAQRIVRAKRRIRAGEVALEMPSAELLEGWRAAVLDVIYLIFSEGYGRVGQGAIGGIVVEETEGFAADPSTCASTTSIASDGCDLIDEALRLIEMLSRHPAGSGPEVEALNALMLLQSSRSDARLDGAGRPVPLAEQDRSRWDPERIEAGMHLLARASRGRVVTSFHLQAGIAACHALASSYEETDWRRILALYDDLVSSSPGDVVLRINRLVALSMVDGPAAAMAELERLERDEMARRYPQLPTLRENLQGRLADSRA